MNVKSVHEGMKYYSLINDRFWHIFLVHQNPCDDEN